VCDTSILVSHTASNINNTALKLYVKYKVGFLVLKVLQNPTLYLIPTLYSSFCTQGWDPRRARVQMVPHKTSQRLQVWMP
jgi:hypothetical protein